MRSSKITLCSDCEREVGPHSIRCSRCLPQQIDSLLDLRNGQTRNTHTVDALLASAYRNHR